MLQVSIIFMTAVGTLLVLSLVGSINGMGATFLKPSTAWGGGGQCFGCFYNITMYLHLQIKKQFPRYIYREFISLVGYSLTIFKIFIICKLFVANIEYLQTGTMWLAHYYWNGHIKIWWYEVRQHAAMQAQRGWWRGGGVVMFDMWAGLNKKSAT